VTRTCISNGLIYSDGSRFCLDESGKLFVTCERDLNSAR